MLSQRDFVWHCSKGAELKLRGEVVWETFP